MDSEDESSESRVSISFGDEFSCIGVRISDGRTLVVRVANDSLTAFEDDLSVASHFDALLGTPGHMYFTVDANTGELIGSTQGGESFRDLDTKARIGGDEFAVYMAGEIAAEDLEVKLTAFLDSARERLGDYCRKYRLSISVGAAIFSQTCFDFDMAYRQADAAMYVAKRHGKDGFCINHDGSTCMRRQCVGCRKECAARRASDNADGSGEQSRAEVRPDAD